jgi:hypothetical protein
MAKIAQKKAAPSKTVIEAQKLSDQTAKEAESALILEDELARYREKLMEETHKKINEYRSELERSFMVKEKRITQEHGDFLKEIEDKKDALAKREKEIRKAEIVCDSGFADARNALEAELSKKRARFNEEMGSLRQQRFGEMEKDLEEERNARLAAVQESVNFERSEFEQYKSAEIQKLTEFSEHLTVKQKKLDEQKELLDFNISGLEAREETLKRKAADIEKKVELCIEDERKKHEVEIKVKNDSYNRLLEELRTRQELSAVYDELTVKCGTDPQKFLLDLTSREEKLKRDIEEYHKKAEAERQKIQAEFDDEDGERKRLVEENNRLKDRYGALKQQVQEAQESNAHMEEMYRKITFLQQEKDAYETQCGFLDKELEKYKAIYKDAAATERRKSSIENPLPDFFEEKPRSTEKISEKQWLERIHNACANAGYQFTHRLLYAFHTALKTAEWSSITVLAGVSGTGKSKLPELYAHFGGINFFPLSVQPNWDSKESMLGFFNTIEGNFDAQPVLRFLAQTQKEKTQGYKAGLKDTLNIVLLDEMNLANVELYFAEFLSKLEERSSRAKGKEPGIPIKLGSDTSEDYQLKLGRNVLWVGTMNQDETTKSLSDKVLDRGIVINFPRPQSLEHTKRQFLTTPSPLLPVKTWDEWKRSDTAFVSDWIDRTRKFVEEINKNLDQAGLAIGYRVWQSIEQYMINHPLVLDAQESFEKAEKGKNDGDKESAKARRESALKYAFEDQLAQKVMPKLRGIETSGEQKKKCLDPISTFLKEEKYDDLVEDFANAIKFGNGQFIWNSSNYLNKDIESPGQADE